MRKYYIVLDHVAELSGNTEEERFQEARQKIYELITGNKNFEITMVEILGDKNE